MKQKTILSPADPCVRAVNASLHRYSCRLAGNVRGRGSHLPRWLAQWLLQGRVENVLANRSN